MYYLQRKGHEVGLLTLTRGEATRQRHRLGINKEEMGRIRYNEMLQMQKALRIHRMDVWNYPDSGLKNLDPRSLEKDILNYIKQYDPHVIVTYPVHGISGFYDHLVCHAVVKRAFVEWKDQTGHPVRLAFFGPEEQKITGKETWIPLKGLQAEEIDCTVTVDQVDIEANKHALDCYETYQSTIETSGIKNMLEPEIHFTFFGENHNPRLNNLFDKLR